MIQTALSRTINADKYDGHPPLLGHNLKVKACRFRDNLFATSDTNLAATLLGFGYTMTEQALVDGNCLFFVFENSDGLEKAVDEFYGYSSVGKAFSLSKIRLLMNLKRNLTRIAVETLKGME